MEPIMHKLWVSPLILLGMAIEKVCDIFRACRHLFVVYVHVLRFFYCYLTSYSNIFHSYDGGQRLGGEIQCNRGGTLVISDEIRESINEQHPRSRDRQQWKRCMHIHKFCRIFKCILLAVNVHLYVLICRVRVCTYIYFSSICMLSFVVHVYAWIYFVCACICIYLYLYQAVSLWTSRKSVCCGSTCIYFSCISVFLFVVIELIFPFCILCCFFVFLRFFVCHDMHRPNSVKKSTRSSGYAQRLINTIGIEENCVRGPFLGTPHQGL